MVKVNFYSFGLHVTWFRYFKEPDGDGCDRIRETFTQLTLGM